ncbi:MAG: sulfotransferase [Anaerolineae bacterium]|nr:sulfotransferase [Anaerolineae bacterium]
MPDQSGAARPASALRPVAGYERIAVVSGLPRSGTSMMMRVLEAGGLAPLTDEIRAADVDNPRGYFEFERVKRLPQGDVAWLDEARGKCVKVISALLTYLPPTHRYDVIFMRRHLEEVLRSQRKMLERRGQPAPDDDAAMSALLEEHAASVRQWAASQPNIALLEVDYNAMMAAPTTFVAQVRELLGVDLEATAMAAAVDATLYRNRRPANG